jgi:putative ABC transport system permease protein
LWAQRLSGRGPQLDGIFIIPKPGADIGSIRSTITDAVAGRALVAEPQARAAQEGMGVNLVRFVAFSAAGFAFVISGFLIFTATGMSIATRRPHLSMMRAIGARREPLVAGLVGEVALYGLIGGIIGSAMGVVIGRAAIGGLPAAFMQTVNVKIEYHLPVWAIPVGIVVAVVASAAAAALAARQVYKVSPIEALAPVGVPAADAVPHWMRYAAAGTAVVMAAVAFAIAMTNLGLISDASISIMFGALLALGFAFGPVLVALCGAVARCFGAAGTVAASAIARAPQRVWVTMMTATIAVAATLAINGAGTNAVDSARQSFASMGQTDIWLSTSEAGLFPTGPLLPPTLRSQIAAIPGVSHVRDSQAGYTTMNGSKVMMFGLAADAPSPLMVGLTDDERRKVLSGNGVVLSRDLAQRLKARTGDKLELQTAQGPKPVHVVAVVPFFSGLTGTLGLEIDRMRSWFNRPGETALQIAAAPGVDHATLIQIIRGIAPASVSVYSGDEAIAGIGRTLQQAFELNNVSWMILVVISALALLNMLMLSVMERRRELGVLRAIGSSRRFTLSTILVEGLSIGVVGGLFGIAFGLVEQYVADFASTQVWSVDVAFRLVPTACLLAFGAIGVCVLGSALPAVRAARVNIVEAVSND